MDKTIGNIKAKSVQVSLNGDVVITPEVQSITYTQSQLSDMKSESNGKIVEFNDLIERIQKDLNNAQTGLADEQSNNDTIQNYIDQSRTAA